MRREWWPSPESLPRYPVARPGAGTRSRGESRWEGRQRSIRVRSATYLIPPAVTGADVDHTRQAISDLCRKRTRQQVYRGQIDLNAKARSSCTAHYVKHFRERDCSE